MQIETMLRVLLTFLTLLASNVTEAMELRQTAWRGRPALLLQGEIERGDAGKLSQRLRGLQFWPHSAFVLLLDGPGGSVGEALLISRLLDGYVAHTVVPKGAKCASACASIVFIAGKYRTIEEGGLLGQHSCSTRGVKDQQCNDLLSKNAFLHGVSYGSVAAFVTYVAPDDIRWFDRSNGDCHGLTRYPFERESGFEKSEPCVTRGITGRNEKPQSAWRIDFKGDGYRAFQRTTDDSKRNMELNLFCYEAKPGSLFLSMDIQGPDQKIRGAVAGVSLSALPLAYPDLVYQLVDTGQGYTQVIAEIPRKDVRTFLETTNELIFTARLKQPYVDMTATTYISNSRKALMFVANNCVRKDDEG
jgi:hypothetical protein